MNGVPDGNRRMAKATKLIEYPCSVSAGMPGQKFSRARGVKAKMQLVDNRKLPCLYSNMVVHLNLAELMESVAKDKLGHDIYQTLEKLPLLICVISQPFFPLRKIVREAEAINGGTLSKSSSVINRMDIDLEEIVVSRGLRNNKVGRI